MQGSAVTITVGGTTSGELDRENANKKPNLVHGRQSWV
jgi:hypothetical protein